MSTNNINASNKVSISSSDKLTENQNDPPVKDHSLNTVSSSVYQTTANVFQNIPNMGDSHSNILLQSAPPLVTNTIESITQLESLKGIPKGFGKLGGGVGNIVNQQLSPTEEVIRKKGIIHITEKIDDLVIERQKNVELQIKELGEILEDKNNELKDISQKLKEVCSGKVSVEEAFPYNYVNLISESFFSLLGYKYPKKFNQPEYKEWCKDLDNIVKSQEENNKKFISSIKETTESDHLNWQKDVEKLKTNNDETSINKSSKAFETTKEFSRGTLLGVVEMLADCAILSKFKKSPAPMMGAMLVLNVLISGLEVKTHPFGRILEIDKTKSGGIGENHPLEFMKRLVNACGVSCLATMAIKLCPQAGNISKLIKNILVPSLGAGFLEVFNSTSSSEEDRIKILNQLTEDLTADAKAYLIPDNAKLKNAMDESALNILLEAVKNIPDEIVQQYLQQEIDKIRERYKVDESNRVKNKQKTDNLQELGAAAIEQEDSSKEKLGQEVLALVVICVIWYLLMQILPSSQTDTTEESGANKTSTTGVVKQIAGDILNTTTSAKTTEVDEQPQPFLTEKEKQKLGTMPNNDILRAMSLNEENSLEQARNLIEKKILERIPSSSDALNLFVSHNEANKQLLPSSSKLGSKVILKSEKRKALKKEVVIDEPTEPVYKQIVKQYEKQIDDVLNDRDIIGEQLQKAPSTDLQAKIMELQFKFNRIVELFQRNNNNNLPPSLRAEFERLGDEACNQLRAERAIIETFLADRQELYENTSRKTNQIFNDTQITDKIFIEGKSTSYTTLKVDIKNIHIDSIKKVPSQSKIFKVIRQFPK